MRQFFTYYIDGDPMKKTKVVEGNSGAECEENLRKLEPNLKEIVRQNFVVNASEGVLGGGTMITRG